MIMQEIIVFTILGAMASLIIGYISTGPRQPKIIALLGLVGAFGGCLSGTFWIIMTGGLDVTLFAYVLPIFVSGFFTFIILNMVSYSRFDRNFVPGRTTRNLSVFAIFILAFFVAFSAFPVAFPSSLNTDIPTIQSLDWEAGETMINTVEDIQMPSTIPITFTHSKSSATFAAISENPSVGDYMDFKIFMTPHAKWTQPYLKIGIYQDKDNSLSLTSGDILWSDVDYKLSNGDSLWRVHCLYEGTTPQYAIYTLGDELLPIFHANEITPSKRDNVQTFLNTPEKYSPSKDMVSWDETGSIDRVITYATIDAGVISTLQGRIYAKTAGNHIIVVKAYDSLTSDPYDDDAPIASYVAPFTVTTPGGVAISAEGETISSSEEAIAGIPIRFVLLGLGLLSLIGLMWARKENMI
jgi:hypothetical protein